MLMSNLSFENEYEDYSYKKNEKQIFVKYKTVLSKNVTVTNKFFSIKLLHLKN